jgi:curved DNA-binding protein CbpA
VTRVQGAIEQGALPPLLRDLYLGRCTGLLHFERAGESGSVCFIKGHIAWGQSSIEECRLGPVLVRHGLIAQESIDQAYEIVGGGRRLGDVLLEGGGIDRDTLDQALALQVRETLLAVFGWHQGSWRFEAHPDEFFKGYDQALRISTGDLILDAVWSVADREVVAYAMGDLDRAVALTTDPLLRFQRITLTEMDGMLVSLADGVRTAAEMLALAPNDPHEAQRSLFGLLCTGLLELVEAPAAAEEVPLTREEILDTHHALPTRDHFEVLGLTRSANADQVREAFVRLARRFHPDVQHQPELAGLSRQIEEIFTRLADADRVLGVPPRRAEYERRLTLSEVQTLLHSAPAPSSSAAAREEADAQPTPEEIVVRAEQEQEAGHHWDALTAVDAVAGEMPPGRLRRRAWLVRARALAQNPKWRKDAEDQVKQVLAEDPASSEAHFVLGQIYRAGGLETRAAAAFRKTLELRPRHAGARAALGG